MAEPFIQQNLVPEKHILLQPNLSEPIDEEKNNNAIHTNTENDLRMELTASADLEKCYEKWLPPKKPKQDILARADVENLCRNQERMYLQVPSIPFCKSSSEATANYQINQGHRDSSRFERQIDNHGGQHIQSSPEQNFLGQSSTRFHTGIRMPSKKMDTTGTAACFKNDCAVVPTSKESFRSQERWAYSGLYFSLPSYRQNESASFIHDIAQDRKEKLSKIDNIFQMFVPAMRSTNISQEFVDKLIDLHKRKTHEEKRLLENPRRMRLRKSSLKTGNRKFHNTASSLSQNELFTYFNCIEESFAKFARSITLFQKLCENDQAELLKRNSLLFVKASKFFIRSGCNIWQRSTNFLPFESETSKINLF